MDGNTGNPNGTKQSCNMRGAVQHTQDRENTLTHKNPQDQSKHSHHTEVKEIDKKNNSKGGDREDERFKREGKRREAGQGKEGRAEGNFSRAGQRDSHGRETSPHWLVSVAGLQWPRLIDTKEWYGMVASF